MLNFETEQRTIEVGNVKFGGQPGENPIVMIATVFYAKHAALLDEKTGKFEKEGNRPADRPVHSDNAHAIYHL